MTIEGNNFYPDVGSWRKADSETDPSDRVEELGTQLDDQAQVIGKMLGGVPMSIAAQIKPEVEKLVSTAINLGSALAEDYSTS